MFQRFDSEDLFKNSIKSGITLFCGAGFSIMASSINGEKLPDGAGLLEELKNEFSDISDYNNLSRACTKIVRSDKASFYKYLEKRFTVTDFDPIYMNLTKLNIKSIYTTNIDDLFFKIWNKSDCDSYLHDRTEGDEYDEDNSIIDYFPLHGCVTCKKEYVFGATEIATAFSQRDNQYSWRRLAKDSSSNPILFWGWNFEDPGPIEAMYGNENNIDNNIKRWVLLFNPTAETVDFLESLNFNIIIGDTESMLNYISKLEFVEEFDNKRIDSLKELDKYRIPINNKTLPSYPIEQYFIDYKPQWSYIYSKKIPLLNYYREVANHISSGKDIIVIGIRCSGKTTLMMQLIHGFETQLPKFFMVAPTVEKVKSFLKRIRNNKCILFVDDCFRDTDAVIILLKNKNIQAVLFDRDFNYERQYHKISDFSFEKVDITEINKIEAQAILDAIPEDLKRTNTTTKHLYKDPTILSLLAKNLKAVNFNFIKKFEEKDLEAAQVFLMVCYVHSCGVPCSFDMIYSFLDDEKYTWQEMFNIVDRIGGLLTDLSFNNEQYPFIDSIQNYYQCRSRYLAEKIINSIPRNDEIFKNVLWKFTKNVPQYKICQYDKFRRSAYDSKIISKAFPYVDEGEEFYLLCSEKDDSEYIYQQAALYFAEFEEYKKAFNWIDKARSLAYYNRFSIDSTYAQIYFDVNIDIDESTAYDALKVLEKCCNSDKRRILHVEEFANRAIKFHEKYNDENSKDFIKSALGFVDDSISEKNIITSQINKWRLQEVKSKLNKYL